MDDIYDPTEDFDKIDKQDTVKQIEDERKREEKLKAKLEKIEGKPNEKSFASKV